MAYVGSGNGGKGSLQPEIEKEKEIWALFLDGSPWNIGADWKWTVGKLQVRLGGVGIPDKHWGRETGPLGRALWNTLSNNIIIL